jgi:hypothetical protein
MPEYQLDGIGFVVSGSLSTVFLVRQLREVFRLRLVCGRKTEEEEPDK